MKIDQPWNGLRFILFPWLFKKRVFEYSIKKTVVYIGEPLLSRKEMMKRFDKIPSDLEPYRKGLDPVTQLELSRFSVKPDLPYGVNLNQDTGSINGIPSERTEKSRYVVEALQKKKRYRAVVMMEVRPHGDLPSKEDIDPSQYVEVADSAYIGAGITRDGSPVLDRKGEEIPPPHTRREKKRARKASERARIHEELEAKRKQKQHKADVQHQAKQSKKDAKAQKKADKHQRKLDKRAGKKGRKGRPSERSSQEGTSERNRTPEHHSDGQIPPNDAPVATPQAPSPRIERDLLSQQAQQATGSVDDGHTSEHDSSDDSNTDVAPPTPLPEPKAEVEPDVPRKKGTQALLPVGATEVEFDTVAEFPESGNAWLGHPERGVRVSWTGKSGNSLIGLTGVKRKVPAGAVFRKGTLQSDAPPTKSSTSTEVNPRSPTNSTEATEGTNESPPVAGRKERKRLKKEQQAQERTADEAKQSPNPPQENTSQSSTSYQKGATAIELDDASALPSSGGAWIGGPERGVHITWTGKNGNTLTGVEGLRKSVSRSAKFVLDVEQEEEAMVEEEVAKRPKF